MANKVEFSLETELTLFFITLISEIIPLYGMSSYITREEQYNKPQRTKIKERQIDRQNRLNSPPSSIYKSCTTVYNGPSKAHNGAANGGGGGIGGGGPPAVKKTERRARSSPKSNEQDLHGKVTCHFSKYTWILGL